MKRYLVLSLIALFALPLLAADVTMREGQKVTLTAHAPSASGAEQPSDAPYDWDIDLRFFTFQGADPATSRLSHVDSVTLISTGRVTDSVPVNVQIPGASGTLLHATIAVAVVPGPPVSLSIVASAPQD